MQDSLKYFEMQMLLGSIGSNTENYGLPQVNPISHFAAPKFTSTLLEVRGDREASTDREQIQSHHIFGVWSVRFRKGLASIS